MSVEILLFAALVCTALVPVLAVQWGIVVRGRTAVIGLVSLWLGLTGAIVWAVLQTDYQPPDSAKNRPRELPTAGYVGSDTCRSCHPHDHATWHASYHRTMTQVATPQSVIGDFDNVRIIDGMIQLHLQRKGGQFLVDITDQTQGHVGRFPIVMTTGSHHMQEYWFASATSPNGEADQLIKLPQTYLKSEQRWVPSRSIHVTFPSRKKHPARHALYAGAGKWNNICIGCHATLGRSRPKDNGHTARPDTHDTQVVEFGIACEACHGPGGEHTRVNQDPLYRYKNHLSDESDSTIVNPAQLSHDLSSQVCGQCHSVFELLDTEAKKRWSVDGFDYRPGDDFGKSDMRCVLQPSPFSPSLIEDQPSTESPSFGQAFWPDGMVRVSGREYNGLINSPCFHSEDAARAKMSCLSCHQMHQASNDPRTREEWANDQLKHDMQGNGACVQCHAQFADARRVAAHTHHATNSSGSQCYNCHMPHTTYGLVKAMRSHQVDSPSVQASLKTGRPNACNQCHLNETLDWTAEHLFNWYQIPKPDLKQDQKEIAASVVWLLSGDAGQRALMAWSYGWKDALQASGTHWQAPYLAQLLEDPYDGVRFIAHRSLRRLPGFADFPYDFIAPAGHRSAARQRARTIWEESPLPSNSTHNRHVLLDKQGHVVRQTFDRLLKARDDRPMLLRE